MTEHEPTTDLARRTDKSNIVRRINYELNALDGIDARIADLTTQPKDLLIFVRVRRELLMQNEDIRRQLELSRVQNREFWAKITFSAGAIATGVALIAAGHFHEGYFLLGVGFFWLAPELITNAFSHVSRRRDDDDAE